MLNIFMTGATGFIGSHLVDVLKQNYSITALVRSTSHTKNIQDKVTFVYADMRDLDSYQNELAKADIVIHSAALVKATKSSQFYEINTELTKKLLDRLHLVNPSLRQFVFLSSQAASRPSMHPISEQISSAPVTHYGRSKQIAEEYIIRSEIPYTIIRPSAVYGPRDKEFLPVFKLISKNLILYPKAEQKLNLVHVEDLTNAINTLLVNDAAFNKTYFIAHPEVIALKTFYTTAAKLLGKNKTLEITLPYSVLKLAGYSATVISKIINNPFVFGHDKVNELTNHWVCSSERFSKDHKFKYKYDLTKGLTQTLTWYKENKLIY